MECGKYSRSIRIPAMPLLLVVEDDPAIAESLRDALTQEGYTVASRTTIAAGLEAIQALNPQLILLDVRLPDGSGFDFCRQVRRAGMRQPIIMLTVQRTETDKVLGLEMGADDYVTKPFNLRELFARDPGRFEKFSLSVDGLLLDYSKQRITEETMRLLAELARECELEAWRARMLTGARVNASEDRAALHVALRARAPVHVEGQNLTQEIAAVLADMWRFARGVRSGRIRGATGRAFTDVLNLGIGGSDLGPRLACDALRHCSKSGPHAHFVSNVDGTQIVETLKPLSPETTLFIIASKTFTFSLIKALGLRDEGGSIAMKLRAWKRWVTTMSLKAPTLS